MFDSIAKLAEYLILAMGIVTIASIPLAPLLAWIYFKLFS